jgi:hypothetical protein
MALGELKIAITPPATARSYQFLMGGVEIHDWRKNAISPTMGS